MPWQRRRGLAGVWVPSAGGARDSSQARNSAIAGQNLGPQDTYLPTRFRCGHLAGSHSVGLHVLAGFSRVPSRGPARAGGGRSSSAAGEFLATRSQGSTWRAAAERGAEPSLRLGPESRQFFCISDTEPGDGRTEVNDCPAASRLERDSPVNISHHLA